MGRGFITKKAKAGGHAAWSRRDEGGRGIPLHDVHWCKTLWKCMAVLCRIILPYLSPPHLNFPLTRAES
ncbi:hypothetical protein AMECASPLE_020270 [Ameca splendens]|uniref:Uncharacterized protein n=1 Tax=Ameca splendens TaxID=208324 RepID=A0ABV0YEM5_9TELE